MKRVLSLTTAGLFLTGLAMVPLSARADQATVDGKTVTTTHTDPLPTSHTTVNGQAAGKVTTPPVTKDEKKVTTTPSGSAPASGAATTKVPGKGSS